MMGHGAQHAMRPGATERPKSALYYAVVRRQKGLIPLRSTIGGKCLRTAAFAYVASCSSRHSCCALQRTCALDSLTLLGRVHHLPKIVAPLHVEPEVRAVAEDAGQDSRPSRRSRSCGRGTTR